MIHWKASISASTSSGSGSATAILIDTSVTPAWRTENFTVSSG